MNATTATFQDEWLVRTLQARGVLSTPQVEELRHSTARYACGDILKRRFAAKETVARAVREQYGLDLLEADVEALDKMALSMIPEKLCRRHLMVPLRLSGETIDMLMANPLDAAALEAVSALTGRRATAVLGLVENIEELIAGGYGSESAIVNLLRSFREEAHVECFMGEEPRENERPVEIGAPVTHLVNLIIAQAVRLKASDIHIEHEAESTQIRYRIDGELRNMLKVPKRVGEGPLVSRIKIMANMDVADRRRPQDGRAKLMVGGHEIGLRVSTVPTAFGEKAVLRLLDKRAAEVPLEALGFRPETHARLAAIAGCAQGMLLVTGPTGSGKTTTLYSLLHRVKGDDVNITTVEDPIEYRLEGINQIQVNEKTGMDFASVLRSVLRQDPDVVLVGEIRDRETADVAFQAALTGHMVFSTLHTNGALESVSRLVDMGVERYKMAPALAGVLAQRLLRRLCRECRKPQPADPALAALLRKAGLPERVFRADGCEKCSFTGRAGRLSVAELLDLREPAARDLVASGDLAALRKTALERGWLTLLSDDMLWHLSQGDVCAEEAAAYLPASDAEGAAAPASPAPPPAAATRGAAPKPRAKSVLIVDDNPVNRLLIRHTLQSEGYELAEADGGAEALRRIAASKPDLLLLDLMMPEMDGFEVVRRLRGGLAPEMPVMVLTAMSESESQALALELGADDYLTKPFDPKILRARVKARFRRGEYAVAGAA